MGLIHKTPSIVTKIIFPTLNMAESIDLYERLGFEVLSYDPGYAWVQHEGRELFHLAHVEDLLLEHNRAAGYFHVQNVDEVHQRWSTVATVKDELGDRPWQMREFSVTDPSNNLIRVGQNL